MVTPGQLNRRAAFFEQLAAMIAAGVPLTKALEMSGRNRSTGVSPKVIQALTHHLQEGHTFTDALQMVSGQKRGTEVSPDRPNQTYWLSDFDIALLSAGEASGRLDVTFKLLARFYASRAKLIHDTIAGSIITIVTLHLFLLVFPIAFLQGFVLGLINGRYEMCLPFIIEKIVAFGLLYGGGWFLAFAAQGNRGEFWRAGVEAVFKRIPFLCSAVKSLVVARLAMALNALLSAGVPVIRAWELSAVSCGSPSLKKAVFKWTPELESGVTPAEMVAQIPYFPDMFTQLYQSGEISGKQDETLARLHTYYEEEGFRKLQTFCRALMLTLYFTLAILIGIFVIRFWTGYFNTLLNSV
jgi:type II secretory pathway component PulF